LSTRSFTRSRRSAVCTIIASMLLIIAALLGDFAEDSMQTRWSYILISTSCGLLNSTCTLWSNGILRVGAVTGILVEIGTLTGSVIQSYFTKTQVATWRIKVLLPIYLCFLLGGVLSSILFPTLGKWSLSIPATVLGASSVAYWFYAQILFTKRQNFKAALAQRLQNSKTLFPEFIREGARDICDTFAYSNSFCARGAVTKSDFRSAIELKESFDEEEFSEFWDKVDGNQTGEISFDELLLHLCSLQNSLSLDLQ